MTIHFTHWLGAQAAQNMKSRQWEGKKKEVRHPERERMQLCALAQWGEERKVDRDAIYHSARFLVLRGLLESGIGMQTYL